MSLAGRAKTVAEIFGHFLSRQRFFLIPLLVVLFLGAVLLVVTGGLSYVAPFIYAIF
jgi:hypothetical protein